MSRFLSLCLLASLSLIATISYAETKELQLLLQKNNCLACHLIDKRKYGPMLKEVAEKYAGESGAVEKLAAKINWEITPFEKALDATITYEKTILS